MTRRLFVDLDGVLADFDTGYETRFGVRTSRHGPDPPNLWENVGATNFFLDLPLMPGAKELWARLTALDPAPVILTGVPRSVPLAGMEKRAWVAKHFGPEVPVITTFSRDKFKHGSPGDILVDDWDRYKKRWEKMGGIFVLHTSVDASVAAVEALLKPGPASV